MAAIAHQPHGVHQSARRIADLLLHGLVAVCRQPERCFQSAYPEVPSRWGTRDPGGAPPLLLTVEFRKDGRTLRFFSTIRELFGWNINRWENPGGIEYWMVETVPADAEGRPVRQGVNGGLMRRMYPNQPPVNYVAVEDVDAAVAKAEGLGAKVLMGKTPVPGMGWFAQLSDTEGNLFAVWQTDMAAAAEGAAAAQADGAGR